MPNKLITDVWDLDAIKGQLQEYLGFLAQAKKGMQDLYDYQKSFKDTTIANLTDNTQQLSVVIGQAAASTNKAAAANQGLAESIKTIITAGSGMQEMYTQANSSLDQNIKTQIRYRAEIDAVKKSQILLGAQISAIGGATDMQASKQVELTKSLVGLNAASKDLQRTIQNQIKEQSSATGSIDQMKASLGQLTQAYDKLGSSAQTSTGGKELQATIQQVNAALTEMEVKTGRSQRKVGDYTGAVATLEEQLKMVNTQLTEMAAKQGKAGGVQNLGAGQIGFKQGGQPGGTTALAGGTGMGFDPARYKQLQQEADALTTVIERQGKGFTSVTQQIRASEQALQTLRAAGLEGSAGFDQLRESTVAAAQSQKEFIRQERLLESEAPVLGAITLAAKGLAGAYAIGAGSVALFADGNEKVEKELNKLVAIMTILQGLQQAYELINKSGAITTALKTALFKAATAVQTQFTASTVAATVATEELTVAEGEAAAAAEVQTVATGELAEAEVVATAATTGLGTALLATGIGAAIAGIAIAIAWVISKIPDWIAGDRMAIKQQEELAAAIKAANEAMVDQVDMMNDLDQATKKYYENQLALSQAAGKNEYVQAAIQKQLTKEELNLAQERVDALGASYTGNARLAEQIQDLNNKRQESIDIQTKLLAIPKQNRTGAHNDQLDAAKVNQELYEKLLESPKTLYAASKKALDDRDAAFQKSGQEDLKTEKFSADEQRKLTLDLITFEIEANKDRNSRILSDARSSSAQRIAAMESDRRLEVQAAQAQRNDLDPNATPAQVAEANAKLSAAKVKANADTNEKIRIENRKEYERNRDAALEATKTQLQDQIQAEQDIEAGKQNNPDPFAPNKVSLAQRLSAFADEYKARRDLINAQFKEDIDKEGLNAEEKKTIEAKYDSDILNLAREMRTHYADLEQQARDQSIREWEMYYAKRKEQIEENMNDQLVALNQSHEGAKHYARNRTRIEDQAAVEQAQNTVEQAENERNSTKDGTQARIDANEKLSKSAEDLSEKLRKQSEDNKNIVKEEVAEDIQNVESLANSGEQIAEIGWMKQQKGLENLEKQQQRSYQQQQRNIEDTTASQEQKALRMKILDDQQHANEEKNTRKQRQLDIEKAKFDKAKAIMDIILNTAVSVTKNLGDPFLEIAIVAAGAAELATAIATPLPKYRMGAGIPGRPEHAGGPAVVGDAYQRELIAEPGAVPYWSPAVPTVLDLAARTKVIPPEEIERMIGRGMFVTQQGVLRQRDSSGDTQQLREAIVWQTGRIERALAKSRPKVVNNIKLDAKFGEHIYKSVFK